jgi:hypothetical protein
LSLMLRGTQKLRCVKKVRAEIRIPSVSYA